MANPDTNNHRASGRKDDRGALTGRYLIEVIFGYVVVLAVIGLVGYLVITNPVLDITNAKFFNTILAIASGIAATFLMGGYLHLETTIKGIGIRAGGGLGVFALVLLGGPEALPALAPAKAEIALLKPKLVDFRPIKARSEQPSWPDSQTVISVEFMTYEHAREETRIGRLVKENAILSIDSTTYSLRWLYFVELSMKKGTGHLGYVEDAKPMTLPPGKTTSHTTMFRMDSETISWKMMIDKIMKAQSARIDLISVVGGTADDPANHRKIESSCELDVNRIQRDLETWRKEHVNILPRYFHVYCI